MCSTPWRRTTVWIGSAAVPCGPSASTSWTTLGRRSSLSPGRSSACPASSPVVYKRWAQQLWLSFSLLSRHIWRIWLQISPNLPHSWRFKLPPVTPWVTSSNSGILSPLSSSLPTSTTSLFWRSTGPSADGAASQMSTSRWVHANILIYKICHPSPASVQGPEACFQSWLSLSDPLPWTRSMQDSVAIVLRLSAL